MRAESKYRAKGIEYLLFKLKFNFCPFLRSCQAVKLASHSLARVKARAVMVAHWPTALCHSELSTKHILPIQISTQTSASYWQFCLRVPSRQFRSNLQIKQPARELRIQLEEIHKSDGGYGAVRFPFILFGRAAAVYYMHRHYTSVHVEIGHSAGLAGPGE